MTCRFQARTRCSNFQSHFCGITIQAKRAVQTSLKNGSTSTIRNHVTQHLDWAATIWIDVLYATGIPTVSKDFGAAFWLLN